MMNTTIAFIGAGNMAHCLIGGLVATGFSPKNIWASNPSQEKLNLLKHEFNIHITQNNITAAEHAQIIVLCVKPQVMKEVITELAPIIKKNKSLIISIATGIKTDAISKENPVVRCMPNLPSFVGSGATGMYANSHVSPIQRDLAENIMRSVGITLWVNDENLIDVIAALSGSGPAYFFYVMEALEEAAVELGLNAEDAHLLALQTALGSAKLALSTNEPMPELRKRVTSKGGITERALSTLENQKVRDALKTALKAAHIRSVELSQ